MSRGGVVSYYNADALGSVAAITNPAGVVQNNYVYDAWGIARAQTEAVANAFTYTAREKGEAGTWFYRARYYSPGVGRMISEDPIGGAVAVYGLSLLSVRGAPDGSVPVIDPSSAIVTSLYSYVQNSPVYFSDPLGLCNYMAGGAGPRPTPRPTPTPVPDWCDPKNTQTKRGCVECCIQKDRENRKKCKYTGGITIFCREVISGKAFQECVTDCLANLNQ
jgi:RHS repeat-associated protein